MRIVLSAVLVLLSGILFGKKVKFAVDMTGQVINPTGVHVTGDFQTLAGYPGGDWASNTTLMTQETADTNIYSVIVDIPAFAKYEYKFVNGDQFYEVEFVQVESRVGYNFDDNRWIYVDSLANDTTFVGAILFSMNAPKGLSLVRFYVDMSNAGTISPNGIHVAGSFQNWDPQKTIMYSFGANLYEVIAYVPDTFSYDYKFYNGNAGGSEETVPVSCAATGSRQVLVLKDTLLASVCFSSCAACSQVGIAEWDLKKSVSLFPNPSAGNVSVVMNDKAAAHTVLIKDLSGRVVWENRNISGAVFILERGQLKSGIYFVSVLNEGRVLAAEKLILE
jgi:hypothetical protein